MTTTTTTTDLSQAVTFHQTGAVEQAEAIYRQVLQEDPVNPDALNLLGVLCCQGGRIEESLELLMKAVQSKNDFVSAHYNYASALMKASRLEEAEAQFRVAIRIDPNHHSAHHNLGAILLETGREADAAECFREVVRSNPMHDEAWHQLALILFREGDLNAASECWQCAAQANPQNEGHRHNLGHVLHKLGETEKAATRYREALGINPKSVATWCNLASALRETGQTDEAIEACQEALRLDPKHADAYNNLGNIHLSCGNIQEALRCADQAISINPEHAAAMSIAAGALQLSCEAEAALAHLDEAVRVQGDDAANYIKRGNLLANLLRRDEAARDFRKALELDESQTEASIGLARILLATGQIDEAAKLLGPLLDSPRPDASAALLMAALHRHEGLFDESISLLTAHLERGHFTASQRRQSQYALGDACDKLGRSDDAFSWYQQANDSSRCDFEIKEQERIFERMKNVFSAENIRQLPRSRSTSDQGLFIVGMPRSGTTLIEQIIDSHPQAYGAGETNFFVPSVREMGELVDMRNFPECTANLTPADLENLGNSCQQRLDEFSPGQRRIVEKTPTNFRFLGLLQMFMPNSRVIFSRRNPIDTCLSCYFHDFTGWHPYIYDLKVLGTYYRLHEQLMEHWMSVLDLPILEVNYEQLVADQEGVTRTIIDFAGLDWDDKCLRFHENPRQVRTASAQQVVKPIYTTSVKRYRPYLKHLGPLLEGLGIDAKDLV